MGVGRAGDHRVEGGASLGQWSSGPVHDAGDRQRTALPGPDRNAVVIALLDKVAADTAAVEKAPVNQGFKNAVVAHGQKVNIEVEVVERKPVQTGFVPQAKRWVVERTYGILMLHRRLVRDYEHRPRSSESRVYWAMTSVILRRLTAATAPAWRIA